MLEEESVRYILDANQHQDWVRDVTYERAVITILQSRTSFWPVQTINVLKYKFVSFCYSIVSQTIYCLLKIKDFIVNISFRFDIYFPWAAG